MVTSSVAAASSALRWPHSRRASELHQGGDARAVGHLGGPQQHPAHGQGPEPGPGGAEADGKAVDRTCPEQGDQLPPTRDFGNEPPAREKAAVILAQLQPDADRLGRIMLKQHRYAADSARRQRIGKGAAHDHVARLIDLAEQAGVTLHGAVGIDGGTRSKNGRDRRFRMYRGHCGSDWL